MYQPILSPFARLSRFERGALTALLLIGVVFGAFVVYRSAFLQKRKTDLNVYLRAAWAVRAGENPYEFITVGESHYNYPPLLALLLVPLADKPAGVAGPGTVPFSLSVAIWYVFSVLALAWAVHQLAAALEESCADPAVRTQPRGCRRWWALRVFPVLVCLPGIARTLVMGQIDLVVLLLLCGTVTAAVRGRSWQAGLWLAGAVCIKLIPAFLLLYPLWRRDWRWLTGCGLGLALGWGLVPAAVLGPARAWDYQRQWAEVVVLPGVGLGADRSRESDLTSLAKVHSQSLVGVFHAFQYPCRDLRPAHASPGTLGVVLILGAVLALWTLAVAGRPISGGLRVVLTFGSLIAVLLLIVPICHPHYFCHWLPLVMGLLARDLTRQKGRGTGRTVFLVFAFALAGNALTSVPGLDPFREGGVATAAGVVLWATGVAALGRSRPRRPAGSGETGDASRRRIRKFHCRQAG
jgi:hypothetical protein